MNNPTKAQKVAGLMSGNPKMTKIDACLLLGIDPNDPEINDIVKIQNMFDELMGKVSGLTKKYGQPK